MFVLLSGVFEVSPYTGKPSSLPYTKNIDFLIPLLTDRLMNALCTKQCACVCVHRKTQMHTFDGFCDLAAESKGDRYME